LAMSLLESINHAEIRAEQPSMQPASFAKEIRSLRAYHNLIAIEKGDNSAPSNMDYRLDKPHPARAGRTIEAATKRAPARQFYGVPTALLARGRSFAPADTHVAGALPQWPDHPALLFAAMNLADMRGDARAKIGYLERFVQLEPGNEPLRKFYE